MANLELFIQAKLFCKMKKMKKKGKRKPPSKPTNQGCASTIHEELGQCRILNPRHLLKSLTHIHTHMLETIQDALQKPGTL